MRKARIVGFLLAVIMFLTSCDGRGGEPGGKTTDVPGDGGSQSESAPAVAERLSVKEEFMGGEIVSVPLQPDEVLLDLYPEGDGYVLLSGVPHDYGEGYHGVRVTLENLKMASDLPLFDARERKLDASFAEKGESVPADPLMTHSAVRCGDSLYTYVCSGYEESEYGEMVRSFALRKDGEEVAAMSKYKSIMGFIPGCSVVEKDGVIYAAEKYGTDSNLYIDGRKIPMPEKTADGWIRFCTGITELGDTVYALMGERRVDSEYVADPESLAVYLMPVDRDAKETSTEGVRMEGWGADSAASDGTRIAYVSENTLYLTDGKTLTRAADLTAYGMTSENCVRRILFLGEDKIAVLTAKSLILLSPEKEAGESIVLGVINRELNYNEVMKTAAAYNMTGPALPVRVKPYGDASKLNLAILSGDVDLVLASDIMAMRNYADRGVLLPLEKAGTKLLEEGTLLPAITKNVKWKAQTFFLPHAFALRGISVTESAWKEYREESGDDSLRNFESLGSYLGFIQKHDTGRMKKETRWNAFKWFCGQLDEWIDWRENTCDFQDGEKGFPTLLTYAFHCAADTDEAVANENQTARTGEIEIGSPEILAADMDFDADEEKWVILPMPSMVHTGYEMRADWYIGMVAGSEHEKEAAAFMEFCLLVDQDFPMEDFLPVSGAKFEEMLALYKARCEETGLAESLKNAEQCMEKMREMVSEADHFYYMPNEITGILEEEAAPYLNGLLDETDDYRILEYVQNRVSIYLAEQG